MLLLLTHIYLLNFIDELLVVTFTNAAASEMRGRILDAIYEYLDEHPEDVRMREQIVKMAKANICTIHYSLHMYLLIIKIPYLHFHIFLQINLLELVFLVIPFRFADQF